MGSGRESPSRRAWQLRHFEIQRPLYQDLRCRLAAWKFRLAWRNFEQQQRGNLEKFERQLGDMEFERQLGDTRFEQSLEHGSWIAEGI